MAEEGRFCLRDDADVALIREWHLHLAVMPLQLEGSSEGFHPIFKSTSGGCGRSHDESVVGDPTTHPYLLNHDSDNDDMDNEPVIFPQEEEDDEEEEEEDVQGANYFAQTQPAYAQPAISRPYDHFGHFRTLNLGAMDPGSHGFQSGLDDGPVDEFEVGQEFADKEAAMMAVKTQHKKSS
ncbi:hypothetical protein PIB30_064456 [Stylosanthes scabra]|uniref:Uncharacterized protein n=1 Tax=Stylosanthes scabra TaxID=79078 RepID=A0ABU6UPQ9_9FABA|nr:hypothetical protein [Stylosanthes scabra]